MSKPRGAVSHSDRNFLNNNGTRALVLRKNRRRSDAQDRPCPECDGYSVAVQTRRAHGVRVQHRICIERHKSHWNADTGALMGIGWGARHHIDGTPRALPGALCYFPGCDRVRKVTPKGTGHIRWCSGHEKQRERHGEANMRPLKFRCTWYRGGAHE